MWFGIVVVLLVAINTVIDAYKPDYAYFAVCAFIIVLLTAGLIYTFRDKKGQPNGKARELNLEQGFRRITFALAIVAALVGYFAGVLDNY